MKTPVETQEKVRLDKWLWAARFYKTRGLASRAISGGKVHLNQQRIKPSKTVNLGQEVNINIGQQHRSIIIKIISKQRGPAPIAQQLYAETEDSLQKRQQQQEQRRLDPSIDPAARKRPNKKQRRQIHRFINQQTD